MNKTIVARRIERVFYGAIVWGVFYLYLFGNESVWNDHSIAGSIFNIPYSLTYALVFKLVFFSLAGFNFYRSTLAKGKGVFSFQRALNVVIVSLTLALLVQFITAEWLGNGSFKGFTGLLLGENPPPLHIGMMTIVARLFEMAYLSFLVMYLYQLVQSNMALSFMSKFRFLLVFLIYGMTLFIPEGDAFVFTSGIIYLLYLFLAFYIYKKTQYNLALSLLSIVILIII